MSSSAASALGPCPGVSSLRAARRRRGSVVRKVAKSNRSSTVATARRRSPPKPRTRDSARSMAAEKRLWPGRAGSASADMLTERSTSSRMSRSSVAANCGRAAASTSAMAASASSSRLNRSRSRCSRDVALRWEKISSHKKDRVDRVAARADPQQVHRDQGREQGEAPEKSRAEQTQATRPPRRSTRCMTTSKGTSSRVLARPAPRRRQTAARSSFHLATAAS